MTQTGLFEGRTRVRYGYSCFGWTRGGGKTWHGGSDEEGLDSDKILVPPYTGKDSVPKSISGKVIQARMVLDRSNLTWEWGWYVTVQLDPNQTPDEVNFLYFCHNAQNLVAIGQKVKTGDVIAIMGNSGNAALADPPFKHCHFEVRATATGRGLDPTAYTGHPNEPGTYGSNVEEPVQPGKLQIITVGPLDNTSAMLFWGIADGLGLGYQSQYTGLEKTRQILTIGPASTGDAMTLWNKAKELNVPYESEWVD